MRVLIYGAGNIGRLYAAMLARAAHDVTLLARSRVETIRQQGIRLEHGVNGQRCEARVQVSDCLDGTSSYELVVVALPKPALAEVLPVLAAHSGTPNVMFFGNNAAGPASLVEALGESRVLLGFPGAAAVDDGGVLRYVITSVREQPTTIGELDGAETERIAAITSAFESAGFPTRSCPRIDAWLKTHVAKILPTACALLRAGGSPQRLVEDRQGLSMMVRAMRECFAMLHAAEVPITPGNHRAVEWLPERLLRFLMRKLFGSAAASIKMGHVAHGIDEWRRLADEFCSLPGAATVDKPALTELLQVLR